jgi:5-amino-6-(5-phosphoribosylamino)uracil reductase/2,5-diamino-6-(ribosylamino)-4(3H)-pyrimidinone 5'-phosphate reductase
VPTSDGQLPIDSQLLNDGNPTLLAVSESASEATVVALAAKPNVEIVHCGESQVDLVQLMNVLEARSVRSLLVEGGSRILHSLFEDNLVSRIIIKHIPVLAGSTEAPPYLRPAAGSSPLRLSRWRLENCFVKSGVAVSIYERASTKI